MALVSYPSASSDSSESENDSEGLDGETPSFFFPFKNGDDSSAFNGEVEPEFESIRPNLQPKPDETPREGFCSSKPSGIPLFGRPEFHPDFGHPKPEVIHPDATAHDETNPHATGLNSAELYKLCGSQAKRVSANDIDLIEIDGSSFVNNQPNFVNDPPEEHEFRNKKFKSGRSGRTKNQITFLAEQAKLHEREINQLSANRFHSKRKTQGRYGF